MSSHFLKNKMCSIYRIVYKFIMEYGFFTLAFFITENLTTMLYVLIMELFIMLALYFLSYLNVIRFLNCGLSCLYVLNLCFL